MRFISLRDISELEKMDFIKKKKKEFIIGILLVLGISLAVLAVALISYPRMTFDRSTLYGAQNENLKDFSEAEGMLTAESGDPWIAVPIRQKLGVYSVRIYVSDMTSQNWAYVYVSNSRGWFDQYRFLNNGMNEINFHFQVLPAETDYVRLDVTDVPGNSMRVDYVVINSWRSVISGVFWELLRFWLAAGVGAVLLYGIRNRKDGRKVPAAAWACSVVLLTALLYLTIRDYSFVRVVDDAEMLWGAYFGGTAALLCLTGRGKWAGLCRHGAVWFLAASSFCIVEILCPTAFTEISAGGIFLNIVILAAGYYLVTILFPWSRLIFLLPNALYLLLGLVNHYYALYRGQLFEFSDIQFAGTAAKVADHYSFAVDNAVFYALLAETAVLAAVCLLAYRDFQKFAVRICLSRRISALAGAGVACLLAYTSLTSVSIWNNDESAAEYGYIRSFLSYAEMSLQRPVPDGYDEQAVKEILASYAGSGAGGENLAADAGSGAETEEPAQNVIVLMDEAFSDLPAVYGFETNTDGMPFIHSLSGVNVRKGVMMPSVFGGGTADTEYEFLTGNSVAFLNAGSAPYTRYINSSRPSMASELASDGYRTVAFHPEHESNYKRNKVYPLLGFQNFLSIEDELTYTDTVRNFVSDAADVKNVEEIYQQSQGKPTFIFNVTMQNHGGYSQDKSAVDVTIYPTDEKLQNPELEEYLSLVRLTDAAFEELVDYFSQVPEKTIILMFGDHQPGLSDSVYGLLDPGLTSETVSAEYLEEMYQVPYIVWANYDLDEPEAPRISPGFLHSLFLDYADIDMSCYDRQIYDCMQSYPAINTLGCYNADGEYFPTTQIDADEVLSDYRKSAYYSLFGKKLAWEYFQ
jgi:phosphoglycerol transferase MdoB-like AlkP superfamily enzyme